VNYDFFFFILNTYTVKNIEAKKLYKIAFHQGISAFARRVNIVRLPMVIKNIQRRTRDIKKNSTQLL